LASQKQVILELRQELNGIKGKLQNRQDTAFLDSAHNRREGSGGNNSGDSLKYPG